MDKETRNAIERATQRARKILEEDFSAQLEGDFDVHPSGEVAAKAGPHLSRRQAFQREKIVAAIAHKRAAGLEARGAVADYLRDAAFTTLNRFVALKMLEARELVQECITRGEQSSGYREFCGLTPGLPLLEESAGYRLYIESLFDELSTEVKVLFDRRDPSSVLWPRRATFEQLLETLNAEQLKVVWSEDETIGWVYQFFNGQEERRKMREESQVPRNSRELAVRNQFFTPRYVVQFLTDNTLGRIWYEMRDAKTVLAERCEYMVLNPEEEFGSRAKKDPRDVRVLDPACGSGHFLLYAFDLLITIYEEAHGDSASPKSESTGKTLAEDYPSIRALRKALPGLILAHNLHGVDIDARCAQIAQLALWIRAQRAYRDFGIGRVDRAQIRRANIIVAEPLVADEQIAKEFVRKLGDAELGRVFMVLVESLNLAGELGVLLRVEQLVTHREKRGHMQDLFAPPEDRIRVALKRFVREEAGVGSTRRKLFADDAAQGVGLLTVAEVRYDVLLMNPPFGEATHAARSWLREAYGQSANDLYSAFVSRALELRAREGLVGVISSRAGFFVSSLDEWRARVYDEGLFALADLGEGVMDSAMVEAAAYCIGAKNQTVVFRLLAEEKKGECLRLALEQRRRGNCSAVLFEPSLESIRTIPSQPFAYWVPESVIRTLVRWPRFESPKSKSIGAVRKGLRTGDNFRFVRAYWEVAQSGFAPAEASADTADGWVPLVMTGASQPWFAPVFLVINWKSAGRELRAFVLKHGAESRLIQARDFYFRPGFSWTLRSTRLYPYSVPSGCIFTGSRPMAFPGGAMGARAALGLFASRTASAFIRWYAEKFSWPKFAEGHLKNVPVPSLDESVLSALEASVDLGVTRARQAYRYYEPFLEFTAPHLALTGEDSSLAFDPRWLLPEEVEQMLAGAYGLSEEDSESLHLDLEEALTLARKGGDHDPGGEHDDDESAGDAVILSDNPTERAWRLVSYCVGALVGRWDVRLPLAIRDPPLPQPVDAPLPKVPSAALTGAGGEFPALAMPAGYPLELNGSGVLVQDESHACDLGNSVSELLDRLGADASAVLHALSSEWEWGDPRLWRTFFQVHIKMYSLGRRKAPIYWQIATPSASYSVWLYIHAFSKDTLFRVQNDYVAPKLAQEERRLESLTRDLRDGATAAQRKALAAQDAFVEELRAFLEEVRRVAPLWSPDLDDGVIINFAPLWRVVPQNKSWQNELKSTWDALCEGKHDWAHLAMHLWPERVVPKCAKDRSLAIAHGLEEVFWLEGADGKWSAREVPTRSMDELVCEGTSPAVKAALTSLLEAPAAPGNGGRGRAGRRRSAIADRGDS